jgi:hypothetical protein
MKAIGLLVLAAACGRVGFTDRSAADARIDRAGDAPVSSLVLRYPMDDDPSTGIAAASIASDDGTCTTCPTATTGHDGGGYAFDGTGWIELPVAAAARIGVTPYSVTVWVRAANGGAALAKPLDAVSTDVSNIYDTISLTFDANQLGFETAAAPDLGDYDQASVALGDGAWHAVAATFDGAFKRLYVDGAMVGTMQGVVSIDRTGPMWIGTDLDRGAINTPFQGELDELDLYSEVLTDAQIAAIAAR